MYKGILINQTYISARPTGISRVAFSLIEEMVNQNGKLFYISAKGKLFEVNPSEIVKYLKDRIFPKIKGTKFKRYEFIRTITTKVPLNDFVLATMGRFFDYNLLKKNEKKLIPYLKPVKGYPESILLTEPILNTSIFKALKKYLRKNNNIETFMICHDIISLRNPKWFTNLAKIKNELVCNNYLLIGNIICISDFTLKTFIEYFEMYDNFSMKTKVVIPLGSPLSSSLEKNPTVQIKNDPINVLYVSAINPRKNHVMVAKILSRISNAQHQIHLQLIVGDSWGEKEILSKLDLTVHDHFHYSVAKRASEAELLFSYQKADFSIYLSLEEGFGLPVLESLSQRCPVLCSNTSSMQEFANLPGVLVVDPTNPEQIQLILTDLITKPDYRNDLRNKIESNTIRSLKDFARDVINYV